MIKNKSLDNYFALFALGTGFIVFFSFGLFRLFTSSIVIGIIDLVLSFTVLLMFIQYLKHGHSDKLNIIFVVGMMSGIFALMLSRPTELLNWVYPMLYVSFFLLNLRVAIYLNLISIITTLSIQSLSIPLSPQFANIAASLIVVCVFGYAFSARAKYHKKILNNLATLDSLTGVGNRRLMDKKIDKALISFNENNKAYSIIMLDLDHFKKVNDTYGHAVGDTVLIDFTALLKEHTKENDSIYRFGGEEFIIITEANLKDAGILAEKIRQVTERNLRANQESTVTVSIGVSELSEKDDAISWVRNADNALYEAKKASRNIVFITNKNLTASSPYSISNTKIKAPHISLKKEKNHRIHRPTPTTNREAKQNIAKI